jgi:hypothetical protein
MFYSGFYFVFFIIINYFLLISFFKQAQKRLFSTQWSSRFCACLLLAVWSIVVRIIDFTATALINYLSLIHLICVPTFSEHSSNPPLIPISSKSWYREALYANFPLDVFVDVQKAQEKRVINLCL